MPNFNQTFKSTDTGAPTLSGTAGSLIALLLACLVNGYATASVSSLSQSGTTVTATLASANSTLVTGDYVTIAGATPGGYNGTVAITVLDSTHFTYQAAAGLGAASGTITYAKSGLGWTQSYTGTNLAVFHSTDANYTRHSYVRIDETGGTAGGQKECAVRAYETMSDVNTGTAPFPTVAQQANGLCWRKSATADATARGWTLMGDDRAFYFVANSDASFMLGRVLCGFGKGNAYKSGDEYFDFLLGTSSFNLANPGYNVSASGASYFTTINANSGLYLARSYSQTGGAIASQNHLPTTSTGVLGIGTTNNTSIIYPNGPDGALWVNPVHAGEFAAANLNIRGRWPGLYGHMHSSLPLSEYDQATNIVGLSGITLLALGLAASSSQGLVLVDRFGPW